MLSAKFQVLFRVAAALIAVSAVGFQPANPLAGWKPAVHALQGD